jgi:ABC-2 type transport system permease protein
MVTALREVAAVARLDLAEVMRSRWVYFCIGVYAVLAGVFVLVGLRESSLMGFTGMGRVLLSFSHALVVLLPLLALTATGQVVNRAREDGSLELLFSHPIRRGAYFAGVTLVRYAVLTVPLVALLVVMALAGGLIFDGEVPWWFLGRAMALAASLLLAFTGIGVAISTWVRSQARATIWLLLAWAGGVALLDFALIGLMLQWQFNPRTLFILASLNPVQAARMALLAGASSELSVLGPVGFFLANRVGANTLFLLGMAWPAVLGLGTWALALRSFRRADIV